MVSTLLYEIAINYLNFESVTLILVLFLGVVGVAARRCRIDSCTM